MFSPTSVADMNTNYVAAPTGLQTRAQYGDWSQVAGSLYRFDGAAWVLVKALPVGTAAGQVSQFNGTDWASVTLAAAAASSKIDWTTGVNFDAKLDINVPISATGMTRGIIWWDPTLASGAGLFASTGDPGAGTNIGVIPAWTGTAWANAVLGGAVGRPLELAIPPGSAGNVMTSSGSAWVSSPVDTVSVADVANNDLVMRRQDGQISSIFWIDNKNRAVHMGSLGNTFLLRDNSDDRDSCGPHALLFDPPLGVGELVESIVISGATTAVLTSAGTVYTAGHNGSGQLGIGDSAVRAGLRAIPAVRFGSSPVVRLIGNSGGNATQNIDSSFLAITQDTKLYVWGANADVNNFITGYSASAAPTQIIGGSFAAGTGVVDATVASTLDWTVHIVTDAGDVHFFGKDSEGLSGDGLTLNANMTATRVVWDASIRLENAARVISCEYRTSSPSDELGAFLLTEDGNLYAAGYNGRGLTGSDSGSLPGDIQPDWFLVLANVAAFDVNGTSNAADASCVAVLADGSVRVWGSNSNGQLGLTADSADHWVPAAPTVSGYAGTFAKAITTGGAYAGTMLLTTTGRMFYSGGNSSGHGGIGHVNQVEAFTEIKYPVGTYGNIVDIGVYGYGADIDLPNRANVWFRTNDGSLYGCGNNESGARVGPFRPNEGGSASAFYENSPLFAQLNAVPTRG